MSFVQHTKIRQLTASLNASSMLKCTALATVAMSFAASNANALPTGGTVVAGDVTYDYNGSHLTANQATNSAITDWRGFDILTGESVTINQPNAGSQSLNRVLGGNMTEIHGSLSSNGQVFIVNSSGVFFGGGAEVNVSSMVVSTADIKNSDFLAGNMDFSIAGNRDASIINKGSLTAAEGGLVALIAPSVRNDGVIQASMGTVALAGAQTATIDMYGDGLYSFSLGQAADAKGLDENGNTLDNTLDNQGSIKGARVLLTAKVAKGIVDNVINNDGVIEATTARKVGGTIVLGAGDGNVRVAGTLDASGSNAGETGGDVTITGDKITVADGALIDASGSDGGGSVRIGGDYQGGGDLQRASYVTVEEGAEINVSATEQGDGGTAIVWSDIETIFRGYVEGKAGVNGGNGGLAEVSSKGSLVFDGVANLSSMLGAAGTLLLDPTNITIDAAAAAGIVTTLGTNNTNVVVTTPAVGPNAGNIFVNADVIWFGLGNLTLNAINSIVVNNNILSFAAGTPDQGGVTLNAGNNIFMNAANILTAGGGVLFDALNTIQLTDSAVASTSGGDVTFNAGNRINLINSGISVGNGDLTLNNDGVFNSDTDNVLSAVNGNISVRQTNAGSIQNAIDAIGTAQSAQLELGAGIFDEAFVINKNNLTVSGEGEGVTVIQPTTLASSARVQQSPPWGSQVFAPIVLAENATNVGVSNLTMDGASLSGVMPGATGAAGLIYRNAGGNVDGVTIQNTGLYGLMGINVSSYGHSANTLNANDVNIFGNTWAPVHAAGDLTTMNVANSMINATGAVWGASYSTGSGGLLDGNTIIAPTLMGGRPYGPVAVALSGVNDLTIRNNNIIGNGANVGIADIGSSYSTPSSDNITIEGNTISNATNGVITDGGSNWNIINNTISAASLGSGVGITFQNVTGTNSASGNIISDFGTGIHNNGTNGTAITGGVLTNNTTGILVNPSAGVVIDGTTINGGTNGVTVVDSASTQVNNTQINNVAAYGIQLTNSDSGMLANNTVNNAGFEAIFLEQGSDNGVVSGNTVNGARNGIWVSASDDSQLSANNVSNVSSNGIVLASGADNAVVDGNTVTGTSANRAAVLVSASNGATISNNTLADIAGNGVTLQPGAATNSNQTVIGNTITAASGNVSGSGVSFAGATGVNNVGDGSEAGRNIITGFGAGVSVEASNVTVDTNTLIGNRTGINVVDSTVTLNSNLIDGGTDGLVVSGNTSDIVFGAAANIFQGQSDNFIKLVGNGLDLTETFIGNQLFDLVGLPEQAAGLNDTKSFLLEDKLTHASDANGLGLLWWNANNLYASGTIQPSIDAAKLYNFNQVNINTGVYNENLLVDGFATGLRLTGADRDVVIKPMAASANTDLVNGAFIREHSGIVHVRNSSGVAIDGIAIDGAMVASGWSPDVTYAGIVAHNADVTVDNVTINNMVSPSPARQNAAGISSYSAGNARNLTVRNTTIDNFQNYGISVDGVGQTFNITDNNILSSSLFPSNLITANDFGILVQRGAAGTISSNIIRNSFALSLNSGEYSAAVALKNAGSVDITGNAISLAGAGILSDNSTGMLNVTNNTIHNVHNGVVIRDFNGVANISNNSISGFSRTIPWDLSKGILLVNSDGATLSNNSILNFTVGVENNASDNTSIMSNNISTPFTGIRLLASDGVLLADNILTNVETGVEVLTSSNIRMLRNTITSVLDGVRVNNSRNIQIGEATNGNTITAGDDAVAIENGSSLVTVQDNTLSATSDGVEVDDSAQITIVSNNVDASDDGIDVDDSNSVTVRANTIMAGDNGIVFNDSAVANIDRNMIDANGDGIVITDANSVNIISNAIDANEDGVDITRSNNITVGAYIGSVLRNMITARDNGIEITGSNTITVANNVIAAQDNGVKIDGSSNMIAINRNQISASSDGVELDNVGQITITNNTITAKDEGVDVDNSTNVTVGVLGAGNIINAMDNGVRITNSDNSRVAYNTIASAGSNGVDLMNSSAMDVVSNVITGAGIHGIVLDNVSASLVDSNTVQTSTLDGIQLVDSSNNRIVGNDVQNSGRDGISLINSNLVNVDANETLDSTRDGIRVVTSEDINVTGNDSQRNGANGITIVDGSRIVLDNNDALSNTLDGISASGTSVLTLTNNTANLNGDDGADIQSVSSLNVTDNVFNQNTDNGLAVNAASVFANVLRNTANSNGNNGVDVRQSAGATISDNTADGNAANGFRLASSANATMSGNAADANSARGYFITNSNGVSFTSNDATNNTLTGVRVVASADLVADNNTLTGNNRGMFVIDSDNARITNSLIEANTGEGVLLENSDGAFIGFNQLLSNTDGVVVGSASDMATIQQNTIFNNTANGVVLSGGVDHDVNDNNIVSNALNGVLATATTDALIRDNNITDNGLSGIADTNSVNLRVEDNMVLRNAANGVSLNGTLASLERNVISNNTLDGVNLVDADGTRIGSASTVGGRNIITNNGGNGIFAQNTSNLVVRDNLLADNGASGLNASGGSNLTVDSNDVLRNQVGVDAGNVSGLTLTQNTISDNVNGANLTDIDGTVSVSGNQFVANLVNGLNVLRGAPLSITNNNFEGQTAGAGVSLDANSLTTLAANTFTNNLVGAFVRGGSTILFTDNTFTNNGVGADVLGGSLHSVESNDFDGNTTGLLLTEVDQSQLVDNTFVNNETGANVTTSTNTLLDGNEFSLNTTGITLLDSVDTNVTNNAFIENTLGLQSQGGANLVLSDNILNDNGVGANITSTGTTLTDNEFTTNTTGLIMDDSAGSTLTGNTFEGNTTAGALLSNSDDVVLTDNIFDGNGVGFSASNSAGLEITDNDFFGNATGVTLTDSEGALFTTNNFDANTVVGASLIGSDNAIFSGDIFTGNALGINLNGSSDVRIEDVTIVVPANGTGIDINNGSADTVVAALTISGEDDTTTTAIRVADEGSSMQFEGNASTFSNLGLYFVLENSAMFGEVLDASQQTFDGINAVDFTVAERDAAEARTIDVADTPTVGDVFYKDFLFLGNEFLQEDASLFPQGLFSFAGQTITAEPGAQVFQVDTVNLSLLGSGGAPTINLAGLSPAAGGVAESLANLSPAAGGAENLADLSPAAGGIGNCGNSFLGAGFALGFNSGSCSVQQ